MARWACSKPTTSPSPAAACRTLPSRVRTPPRAALPRPASGLCWHPAAPPVLSAGLRLAGLRLEDGALAVRGARELEAGHGLFCGKVVERQGNVKGARLPGASSSACAAALLRGHGWRDAMGQRACRSDLRDESEPLRPRLLRRGGRGGAPRGVERPRRRAGRVAGQRWRSGPGALPADPIRVMTQAAVTVGSLWVDQGRGGERRAAQGRRRNGGVRLAHFSNECGYSRGRSND